MTGDSGACWRCRWFDRDGDEGDGGYCRRYPPAPIASDDGDLVLAWPGVDYLDWCGEFRPQEEETHMAGSTEMRVVLDDGARMPERAHATDAGLDLRCREGVTVPAHGGAVVDTGVRVELPHGTCGLLVSKSGLNVRRGVTSTGLIDEGYQGSVVAKLYNHTGEDVVLEAGDKVTQLVVVPCEYVVPVACHAFGGSTERGEGGFGSTGR